MVLQVQPDLQERLVLPVRQAQPAPPVLLEEPVPREQPAPQEIKEVQVLAVPQVQPEQPDQ